MTQTETGVATSAAQSVKRALTGFTDDLDVRRNYLDIEFDRLAWSCQRYIDDLRFGLCKHRTHQCQ